MEDRERILHLGDGNPQRVDIPVNLSVGTKVPDIEVGTAAAGRRLILPDIGGYPSDPLTEYRISFFSNSAMVQSPSSHSIASGEKNEIR